ncbi:MAG: hypothetical protein AB1698_20395 [Pseudomonadota bacterium]
MSRNRSDLRVNAAGMLWVAAKDQAGKQVHVETVAQNWTTFRHLALSLGWSPGAMPPYPFSHPVLATISPGSGPSRNDLTLNPRFMDWMMGWPIGWSDSTRSVTGFAPWLLLSRGALSEIASDGQTAL